jgi:hypothetical protein
MELMRHYCDALLDIPDIPAVLPGTRGKRRLRGRGEKFCGTPIPGAASYRAAAGTTARERDCRTVLSNLSKSIRRVHEDCVVMK